jgi:hypothetical protein
MIKTMQDRQPGVVSTGITGTLTLTKTGTTARTATFPNAAITVAGSASALTSGRVPYVTTGGLLTDDAGFEYNSATNALSLTILTASGAAAQQVFVDAGSNITPDIQMCGTGATASIGGARFINNVNGPRWFLGKSRGATVGTFTAVQASDILGSIHFDGSDGAQFQNAATIISEVDGALGATGVPGRILFKTAASNSLTPTTRLTLDSTGVATFAATVTVPNGTAAAPGIRTTTYAHGMYSIGATSVGISVAGALELTIGSTASSLAAGSIFTFSDTTDATTTSDGSVRLSGGLSVAKATVGLTLKATSTADGAITTAGKITAKAAVPGSFADLAAVQTYLASILT